MSLQNNLIVGFDPTTDPSIPANIASAILQAIQLARGINVVGTNVGTAFLIIGSNTPDVINNIWMKDAVWWDVSVKAFKYYDTTAGGWDQIKFDSNAIDSLPDGLVTISNLADPGANPGKVLAVNNPISGTPPYYGLQFVKDLINSGELTLAKLVASPGVPTTVFTSAAGVNTFATFNNAFITGALDNGGVPLNKLAGNNTAAPGVLLAGYKDGSGNYVNYWVDSTTLPVIWDNLTPDNSVKLSKLEGHGATDGQLMAWNDTLQKWIPYTISIPAPTTITPYTSNAVSTYLTGAYTITHGLGAVPKNVQVSLICISADASYAVDDEVLASNIYGSASSNDKPIFGVYRNATTVGVTVKNYTGVGYTSNKLTGADALMDFTKWKIKVYIANIV